MDMPIQDIMAEGIYSNATIETLLFNKCVFEDGIGITIKKIISKRGEKINESMWLKGLRGDVDEVSTFKGISSITLKECGINDSFISHVIHALSFDQYVRVYNLQVL